MRQANQEIRRALAVNGIRQWELARAMGVSEFTLCKRLRTEVNKDTHDRIMQNIEFLAELKNKEEEA